MRPFDNRRAPRKSLHYPVAIEVGEEGNVLVCILSDASETGARLTLKAPGDPPDTFMLRLSHDGKTRRKCNVVWRSEHQIGIAFQKETPAAQPVFLKRPVGSR